MIPIHRDEEHEIKLVSQIKDEDIVGVQFHGGGRAAIYPVAYKEFIVFNPDNLGKPYKVGTSSVNRSSVKNCLNVMEDISEMYVFPSKSHLMRWLIPNEQ